MDRRPLSGLSRVANDPAAFAEAKGIRDEM
jgi:hypothetical protein